MMRVLVADDHSLFRDGIISLLEAADFDVVGEAGNGEEAVQLALNTRPDIVLLDINMPEKSGLEALVEIKAKTPFVKVVMLSVSEEDADLFAAIRAGADGYLSKSLDADQFFEMLDGLRRGEAAITRKTAARLMSGLANQDAKPISSTANLTARELDLLHLVAEGMANKAIAQHLGVSDNTVKYHMRNILQKLNAQNRTEAVMNALQAGILKP
jgi:DNA-binding NarL/FixJ family response regulator